MGFTCSCYTSPPSFSGVPVSIVCRGLLLSDKRKSYCLPRASCWPQLHGTICSLAVHISNARFAVKPAPVHTPKARASPAAAALMCATVPGDLAVGWGLLPCARARGAGWVPCPAMAGTGRCRQQAWPQRCAATCGKAQAVGISPAALEMDVSKSCQDKKMQN